MSGLKGLSSDQLLAQLLELVQSSRKLEADLIACLAEVDARRLYLREGCSSMFAYCVGVLCFAEAVAYKRIAAMRVTRRHPELLVALRKGDLHLTAVSLLAPQLTGKMWPSFWLLRGTTPPMRFGACWLIGSRSPMLFRPFEGFRAPLLILSHLRVVSHPLVGWSCSTSAPRKPKFRGLNSRMRAVSQYHLPLSQTRPRAQPCSRLGYRNRLAMNAI